MKQSSFDKLISIFSLIWIVLSLFWFRAHLGEGYNITFFVIIAFIFGLQVGAKLKFKK